MCYDVWYSLRTKRIRINFRHYDWAFFEQIYLKERRDHRKLHKGQKYNGKSQSCENSKIKNQPYTHTFLFSRIVANT